MIPHGLEAFMLEEKKGFPKTEKGYFHLTPNGWVRKDIAPFPPDRCETWRYEMEWPAEDAKERITLAKVWISPASSNSENNALRARFESPISPTPERNVTLECRV